MRPKTPSRIRSSLTAAALTLATAAVPAWAAAAPVPEPVRYVALGDSYSANVLVKPWTPVATDKCGRSLVNYPSLSAKRLDLALTDVTCGDAEVRAGILEPQPAGERYGPRPAQLDALRPDTDLVTIGVGGNSLGFEDILRECLARGLARLGLGTPCTTYYTSGDGAAWLSQKFADLDADYRTMLGEVHRRAPAAKVALVGYPSVVDTNAGCSFGRWKQFGTVARADMPWLDSVERRLNDLIRDHAVRAGDTYVDTYTPSVGRGVCAPAGQRWMYGIKDDLTGEGSQKDTPSSLCSLIPADGEACTFVHPNADGARGQAEAVSRALSGLAAGGLSRPGDVRQR
ncbi:SGNH/GDSL hydrolase family protein [Streptomyces sp. NPDC012888]|uniref:SGNH/GDSL hydrolase family protein n=1 Tax=Streptomyces sp. NPDC012888 TaxID=3364855 RepID=UPI003677E61C